MRREASTVGEYFKPWRRKIGVVTLAFTCVIMVGWIRSYSIVDYLIFEEAGFVVTSLVGRVDWGGAYAESPKELIEWRTVDVRKIPPEYHGPEYRNYFREISYPSVVLPLTMVAAWLLLATPRKSIPKKIAEPMAEGT